MRTVGVTGGAGFIGGHVIDRLNDIGYDVISFDHIGRPVDGAETMLGDVRDPVAMTELAAHCDGIIHLAAVLGTQETIANPRPAVESNVVGGLNFLEAITQYDLPGVYICVGNHWMNNAYSISKTTVERFCSMYADCRGTQVGTVRVVNAYGPRQVAAAPYGPGKVRKIMPAFICRALSGHPIEVYGDGEQVSDMVHVTDVAKALVATLESSARGAVPCKTIEVGPAEHHTVNDVAHAVSRVAAHITGSTPVEVTHLPMRPGEIPGARVTADTLTLPLIGMKAHDLKPIETGIFETVAWFDMVRGEHWT